MADTIQQYTLAPGLTMRVRCVRAHHNTDGSVLLRDGDRLLECVRLMETSDNEYTEPGWIARFRRLYGFDAENKSDAELEEENAKAREFSLFLREHRISLSALRALSPSTPPTIVEYDGGTLLMLKAEVTVPPSRNTIGHIEHVSLRLELKELVF